MLASHLNMAMNWIMGHFAKKMGDGTFPRGKVPYPIFFAFSLGGNATASSARAHSLWSTRFHLAAWGRSYGCRGRVQRSGGAGLAGAIGCRSQGRAELFCSIDGE